MWGSTLMILTNGVIHVQHHFPDSIVVFKSARLMSFFKSNLPYFFRWSPLLVILWIGHPPLSSRVAFTLPYKSHSVFLRVK